jgi:hypothetical protein
LTTNPTTITLQMKLCCVTYKDNFSSGGKAINDLRIGQEKSVVGCGSAVFGSCDKGDLVLINAEEHKIRHVIIGVIEEKLDSCDAWRHEGGATWAHNFTYKPLTYMFTVDDGLRVAIEAIAKKLDINKHNVFNSRFCSIKCKEIVDMLVERHPLPPLVTV